MLSRHPHFVAKLIDGRPLVVEYKGGDRFSNDDSKHKVLMGAPSQKSLGKLGVNLMAVKQSVHPKTWTVEEQIKHAILG